MEPKINPEGVCEASWLLIGIHALTNNDFLSPWGGRPVRPDQTARRGTAPNAQGAIPLKRGDQIGSPDFGPPPIKERNGGWEPKREAPDTPATCKHGGGF